MSQEIKAIWAALAGHYTQDAGIIDRLYGELLKKYTSPRRHYHNLHHIGHLLQLSEQYSQQLQDKDLVDFSIFYHDIIYNVLRKDNEKRSAVLAGKRLTELTLPGEKIAQVQQFIEATQSHLIPGTVTNKTDLALFLDFDMSILAANREAYSAYVGQVRKEYRVYPDSLYKPGRKKFLINALRSSAIFHSPHFKAHYESRARANMEWELQFY
jgi:predicted metal-dependent HD superfamily phosphohydrolase